MMEEITPAFADINRVFADIVPMSIILVPETIIIVVKPSHIRLMLGENERKTP